MIERPDAIIIGSGAAGGTAAHALTARGWQVVVLEKGPHRSSDSFLPYDELRFLQHKELTPSVREDPVVYVPPTGAPRRSERWWVANMVGGATMIWEANVPRYTQEDFAPLSYIDVKSLPDSNSVSLVNWPWSYDEFQPYFERAEFEWCVSGKTNQSPAQEPFRPGYDYAMPPLRSHASTPFLTKLFNERGLYPYITAKAINSRTHDGRPGCPFCGYCQNFGCAVNDRASSTNTVLARALATGRCDLRTDHCATRVEFGPGGVRGVWYKHGRTGPERFLAGPKVLVAMQAVESARLFLLSGVPNPNDMIGRNLTYHTKGSVDFLFPSMGPWDDTDLRYQPRSALGSLQLRDFYRIADKTTYLTKGGKFTLYDPYTTSTPISMASGLRLWGSALLDRLNQLRSHGGVGFSFTGEALPLWENRVELDPDVTDPWGLPVARLHYRHHRHDLDLSKYMLDRIVSIIQDAGGLLTRRSPQDVENSGYGHAHGTLRAGTDRASSVLNARCESHEVGGLYAIDCSFMPTSGATNPTLTMIANVLRVCETI
jgi:choline dehydrogenase-like flavoprotein